MNEPGRCPHAFETTHGLLAFPVQADRTLGRGAV